MWNYEDYNTHQTTLYPLLSKREYIECLIDYLKELRSVMSDSNINNNTNCKSEQIINQQVAAHVESVCRQIQRYFEQYIHWIREKVHAGYDLIGYESFLSDHYLSDIHSEWKSIEMEMCIAKYARGVSEHVDRIAFYFQDSDQTFLYNIDPRSTISAKIWIY